MEREHSNRTRRITLRLTEQEYKKIEERFKASCCRKLSDYIRKHLFNKPITNTFRNQSMDDLMEETIVLNTELRAIGKNINQIAKKINSLQQLSDFKEQLTLFEMHRKILFNKIENISKHTLQMTLS